MIIEFKKIYNQLINNWSYDYLYDSGRLRYYDDYTDRWIRSKESTKKFDNAFDFIKIIDNQIKFPLYESLKGRLRR